MVNTGPGGFLTSRASRLAHISWFGFVMFKIPQDLRAVAEAAAQGYTNKLFAAGKTIDFALFTAHAEGYLAGHAAARGDGDQSYESAALNIAKRWKRKYVAARDEHELYCERAQEKTDKDFEVVRQAAERARQERDTERELSAQLADAIEKLDCKGVHFAPPHIRDGKWVGALAAGCVRCMALSEYEAHRVAKS